MGAGRPPQSHDPHDPLPYARPGTPNRLAELSDADDPFPANDPLLILRMVIGAIGLLLALVFILFTLMD